MHLQSPHVVYTLYEPVGVTAPGPLCPRPVLVTFAYVMHGVHATVLHDLRCKDEHAAHRHTIGMHARLHSDIAQLLGMGDIECYLSALTWTCCTPYHQSKGKPRR